MNAANQPHDTWRKPLPDTKCDKCDQPARVIAPDFALCAEHGRAVIEMLESLPESPAVNSQIKGE